MSISIGSTPSSPSFSKSEPQQQSNVTFSLPHHQAELSGQKSSPMIVSRDAVKESQKARDLRKLSKIRRQDSDDAIEKSESQMEDEFLNKMNRHLEGKINSKLLSLL